MKNLLAAMLLMVFATLSTAVPMLADPPVKWEYGEVVYRSAFSNRNGRGADPNEGVQPPQPATPAIRWVTARGETTAKSWEDLADKLKAPAPEKGAANPSPKLRAFDRLGADGWELIHFSNPGTSQIWTFKRRVP